jgi:protocatechuate 3,4-dioxygenase beta subunit
MVRVSLLLVAFGLSSASSSAAQVQTPSRDQSSSASSTAKIRGVVVASDDGRPLRRVVIRASAPELREPRAVMTDQSGRYELSELPAGRYNVSAARPGFVTINHGQTRPNEIGRPVDVREGQTVDRINFTMPAGAAITGRVVDEYGEPVAGASVQVLQLRNVNGRLQPVGVSSGGFGSQTPDTGEFRVWGLAPGDYVVQAAYSRGFGPFDAVATERAGYLPTFYPNSATLAGAQSIRVDVGRTTSGIEIVLNPTPTARISGTTIDSRGQPLRGGYVNAWLQSSDWGGMQRDLSAQIKPDGTFTVAGAAPGTYHLRANGPTGTGATQPESLLGVVTLDADDVSGVVLTPVQPATITGRILFDPPGRSVEPSAVRVVANPIGTSSRVWFPVDGRPVINDDFTFEAKAAPGGTRISAYVATGSEWAIKAVTLDGRDITREPIELASGATVKGIDILLTNRFQLISGSVTNDRGDIVNNVTVFVFPQDSTRPANPLAAPTAVGRPDQNGRYAIRARLEPGDYYAVAVDYLDPMLRNNRAYQDELSRDAVRFSIREEESKALDLKISTPQ